ncbi:peptidase S8 [Rhizocola hellebori]|uniref:Peptidase S8 n=1 Tax=Rhizocola hellebori TaxID=1392758 RepID=A0A8J3VLL3_9ACTN|nr:peptidase S8 [Rhizocola hellebori]
MAPPPRADSHTGAIVAAVLTGLWLVVVAAFSQYGGWLFSQVMLALGLEMPGFSWPVIGLVAMLFAGGPALALALIPRLPAVRECGRAWAIGSGALGLGTGLRAIPGTENEWYLFALAAWAGIGYLVFRRRARFSWWGVVAGLIVLVPFLWVGALGGVTDTLLAVLAAIAVGGLASSTLDTVFFDVFEPSRARRIWLGGLAAGVALALIGAGAGGNGVQILMLLVLPPLGFAAAALRSTGALVGIAAFGPLAFVDPVEVNFFLLERDIPFWAFTASAIAWSVGLVFGLGYGLASRPLEAARRPLAIGTAVVVALGAGAVYAVAGQPGFYGDQLFVVMKEQASLAGLPTTTGLGPGRDQRVEAVYRRLVEHANRTQAPLRAQLDRWKLSYQPYYLVNAILVNAGPEVRAWLELRDDVDRVLLDQRLRPLPQPVGQTVGDIKQPPAAPEWNLQMIGAPGVWPRSQGQQIVVGSSDSGVDGKHPALASGFRGGDDSWYDPWNHTTFPVDHGGHGTHTMGTAVGKERVGVAPGSQWVACVNLDRNMGSPSFYLDCMQFMLAPFAIGGNAFTDGRPARAPHVLTNSWGCPPMEGCDIELTRPATDALAAAGIAFVAAAGNEGDRCGSIDAPPATDPAAFTVAAVNEDREVTSFSSRGQPASGKPDASAPGAQVLSAMPGNTYGVLDGTSMATPHVAGALALLWSVRPELVGDLDRSFALLRETATPVSGSPTCGDLEDAGAGIINVERAVLAAAG